MMTIFLVVVALVMGYTLGLSRRDNNKTELPPKDDGADSYGAGYYQAINDVRKTAKVLNRDGEAAPVDKVLTTLLGRAETPSYKVKAETSKTKKATSKKKRKNSLFEPIDPADLLPNITLVVGAVLILASASLFTVWIQEPIVTSIVLAIGVIVFFWLALKLTEVKSYVPAGVTLLALSIALVPIATSPVPGLTLISQWIITSIVATAMLAYFSRYRSFALIPYVTTLAFFSLIMSIARGLTDDIFWSFVALLLATLAIYLLRLKKPLYVAFKFDTPALLATAWVPGIAALVSVFYIHDMGVEKVHIVLSLALAYYLLVWLNSSRYIHELIAKVIALVLLSSITYEHIAPVGMIYSALSFTLIGTVMVASSLVGWSRAKKKRYIFAYEVAWLVAGLATLWYAYAISSAGSPHYLFASVIALVIVALSLLASHVSKRIWFRINAVLAAAMAVVSITEWIGTLAPDFSYLYLSTAIAMTAIGGVMVWQYIKTSKEASYIAAGSAVFFAYLGVYYLSMANMEQFRLPEVLIAVLGYAVARRHKWPVIYLFSNLFIFYAISQLVMSAGDDRFGAFTLMGALAGLSGLALMAFLQKEHIRKWTLAAIAFLALPTYIAASLAVSGMYSHDTLQYASLSILAIGVAAFHILHIRKGAVRGVRLAHELTAYGLLILAIESLRLVDVSGYIHQAVYAHMIGAALVYSSIFIYSGSKLKRQALIRQISAAVVVSGSMAIYALAGTGISQILFLVEHALLVVLALKLNLRWLVYWGSAMLVLAAVYILKAPAAIMLFLVGAGLIAFVVRSVSKK